jgi:hypothetical protein
VKWNAGLLNGCILLGLKGEVQGADFPVERLAVLAVDDES